MLVQKCDIVHSKWGATNCTKLQQIMKKFQFYLQQQILWAHHTLIMFLYYHVRIWYCFFN